MEFADLHLHTMASDGSDDLMRRVRDAKGAGISCIAITDHDTLHPDLDSPVQDIRGVEVISGAELEVVINGLKVEILAYFVDRSDDEINTMVEKLYHHRIDRMREMVGKVNEVVDKQVTFEEVREIAGTTIARPHLARALVEKNIADSMTDAFESFISRDSYAYVPLKKMGAGEMIRKIHNAGGVTSLAHPGRNIPADRFEEVLSDLRDMGLDAVEAKYYYERFGDSSKKIYFKNELARDMARKFDMIITGGSDCHGSKSGHLALGKMKIDYERVKELKERRKRYLD